MPAILLLLLRLGLINGVQYAKIMFGMLKITFSHHSVTNPGCIPPEL